jgi:hypothetical protein
MKATEMFKQASKISCKRGINSLLIILTLMEQLGAVEAVSVKQA